MFGPRYVKLTTHRSSAEVKNEGSYTSASPVCCLGVNRGSIAFFWSWIINRLFFCVRKYINNSWMLMEPKMLTGRPDVDTVRVSRQLLAGWRDVRSHWEVKKWAKLQEQLNLFWMASPVHSNPDVHLGTIKCQGVWGVKCENRQRLALVSVLFPPPPLSLKFGRVSTYAHLLKLLALIDGVVECDLPTDTTCCNGHGAFWSLSVLMTAFVKGCHLWQTWHTQGGRGGGWNF